MSVYLNRIRHSQMPVWVLLAALLSVAPAAMSQPPTVPPAMGAAFIATTDFENRLLFRY